MRSSIATHKGKTPLQIAQEKGHTQIVELLQARLDRDSHVDFSSGLDYKK